MIVIPDNVDKIVLTSKDYPELGEDTVTFYNPSKLKKNLEIYHKVMVQKYFEGAFKKAEDLNIKQTNKDSNKKA